MIASTGRLDSTGSAVDLYWIPLGAGANSVRLNGKVFEAIVAFAAHRPRCDLYHSSLEIVLDEQRFIVEMTPIPDLRGGERGVVCEGPVGTRLAGRFRLFRYEIRRWRGGVIPDAHEAVGGPMRVANGRDMARRILDLVPLVPTPVWGRDELHVGEMWNSNSVTSWLLEQAGADTDRIRPPQGGRAPGWDAGLVVARRAPDGGDRLSAAATAKAPAPSSPGCCSSVARST